MTAGELQQECEALFRLRDWINETEHALALLTMRMAQARAELEALDLKLERPLEVPR
jgi:hypothetical protein